MATMEKPTHSHVIPMPLPYMGIRAVQLLFAIIVLGLSAFLTSNTHPDGGDFPAAYGLTLFTSLASLIIIAYFVVSSLAVPAIYNMWAIVALDIFAMIFWLCSMATMAAFRASFTVPVIIFRREIWVAGHTALNVQVASAVFSAFELVLFAAGLAFFAVKLNSHLKGNSTTADSEGHGMTTVAQSQPLMQQGQPQQAAPVEPQFQPAVMQPQPQYPQQFQQQQPQYQQPQPPTSYQQPQAQPQYQQPPAAYPQQPIPQEPQRAAAEVEGQSQFAQPQYQQPHYQGAAPYGGISPVSSPPPPQSH